MPAPKRQLKSRPPLARMLRLHQLLQSEKFPNCTRLAKQLEVSSKTIQRDIEYMRDSLNLPIEYEPSQHGYFYTQPVSSFPSFVASEGELLALVVAQKALEPYRGTPFERPLALAFTKLAASLQDTVTVDLEAIDHALSFRHTGVALTDLAVFQSVTTAVLESRELVILYSKVSDPRPQRRRLQPYHLGSIDGQWYLFAYDLARKDIRTFVLTRIQEVVSVGDPFQKPADFDLRERLMGAFGVFKGSGDFKVRIQFDAYAAQLVRERHWHESQTLVEQPDGCLELQMRLDALEEVERWVLSWGSHARVLAPVELKQRVTEALQAMQESYRVGVTSWLSDIHQEIHMHAPDQFLRMVMAMDRRMDSPGQMELELKGKD